MCSTIAFRSTASAQAVSKSHRFMVLRPLSDLRSWLRTPRAVQATCCLRDVSRVFPLCAAFRLARFPKAPAVREIPH